APLTLRRASPVLLRQAPDEGRAAKGARRPKGGRGEGGRRGEGVLARPQDLGHAERGDHAVPASSWPASVRRRNRDDPILHAPYSAADPIIPRPAARGISGCERPRTRSAATSWDPATMTAPNIALAARRSESRSAR